MEIIYNFSPYGGNKLWFFLQDVYKDFRLSGKALWDTLGVAIFTPLLREVSE
jgi:hypothetical protein